MKNRTVIGIICITVSVAAVFLLGPLASVRYDSTVEIPRLKNDLPAGSIIAENDIETVKVGSFGLPDGVIKDSNEIIGKITAGQVYAGDYLTASKLDGNTNSKESVLNSLNGEELALTIAVSEFADSFSGQLRNGDIVQLYICDKKSGEVILPPELTYVSVITTVNSSGYSLEEACSDDDRAVPASIMLRVNSRQAALLFSYSNTAEICCAFVCHSASPAANACLEAQHSYFIQAEATPEEEADTGIPAERSEISAEASGAAAVQTEEAGDD